MKIQNADTKHKKYIKPNYIEKREIQRPRNVEFQREFSEEEEEEDPEPKRIQKIIANLLFSSLINSFTNIDQAIYPNINMLFILISFIFLIIEIFSRKFLKIQILMFLAVTYFVPYIYHLCVRNKNKQKRKKLICENEHDKSIKIYSICAITLTIFLLTIQVIYILWRYRYAYVDQYITTSRAC